MILYIICAIFLASVIALFVSSLVLHKRTKRFLNESTIHLDSAKYLHNESLRLAKDHKIFIPVMLAAVKWNDHFNQIEWGKTTQAAQVVDAILKGRGPLDN